MRPVVDGVSFPGRCATKIWIRAEDRFELVDLFFVALLSIEDMIPDLLYFGVNAFRVSNDGRVADLTTAFKMGGTLRDNEWHANFWLERPMWVNRAR